MSSEITTSFSTNGGIIANFFLCKKLFRMDQYFFWSQKGMNKFSSMLLAVKYRPLRISLGYEQILYNIFIKCFSFYQLYMQLSKIILIGVTIDESQILSMYEETLSHPLGLYESRDLIISYSVLEIKGGSTDIFSTDVH